MNPAPPVTSTFIATPLRRSDTAKTSLAICTPVIAGFRSAAQIRDTPNGWVIVTEVSRKISQYRVIALNGSPLVGALSPSNVLSATPKDTRHWLKHPGNPLLNTPLPVQAPRTSDVGIQITKRRMMATFQLLGGAGTEVLPFTVYGPTYGDEYQLELFFGSGNNGMTGFTIIFGWPIGQRGVVIAIAAVSVAALAVTMLGCRLLLQSRFGVLMIAARDDEVRLRTLGYDTLLLKLAVWCLSALIAALAGMLYVPQVGIINPRLLAPDLSLEIAVWVAIGGRGHLIGAVIGAVLVNALKFWLSAAAPELWPFILSGLIVLVAFVFPNGLIDLAKFRLHRPLISRQLSSETPELR